MSMALWTGVAQGGTYLLEHPSTAKKIYQGIKNLGKLGIASLAVDELIDLIGDDQELSADERQLAREELEKAGITSAEALQNDLMPRFDPQLNAQDLDGDGRVDRAPSSSAELYAELAADRDAVALVRARIGGSNSVAIEFAEAVARLAGMEPGRKNLLL